MSTRTAHPRPVPDRAASLRQLVDDTVRRLRACTWNQYVLIEYGESEVLGLQRPDRASDGTFASVRRGRLARDLRRSVGVEQPWAQPSFGERSILSTNPEVHRLWSLPEDCAWPYAQIAANPRGYWMEIVSEEYLPGDVWESHAEPLLERGWTPPMRTSEIATSSPNWHRAAVADARYAVEESIRGLLLSRGLSDPGLLRVGTFVLEADPQGGEPVDVEDAAVIPLRTERRVRSRVA